MIIWKLFDGKIMHTDLALNLKKQKVIRNGQLADRSSIWMLSVHAWYFQQNHAKINQLFNFDFAKWYKAEYMNKLEESAFHLAGRISILPTTTDKLSKIKKKNQEVEKQIKPDYAQFMQYHEMGQGFVYLPIIVNYAAKLDIGHRDFVRSFVHLEQRTNLSKT